MDYKERKNILVTCGPGLKDFLEAELEVMGFEILETNPGGVVTRGSLEECMELNYSLRTAYSVLYLLREFRCGNTDTLYKQVSQVPWENIISPDEYLCVISNVDTWSVNNTMFANLKVKDAIVDRIMRKKKARPDSGSERDNIVVNLYWKHDRAWLYLNTSGRKLSDRGYRKMPHKAPLRENLAAGMLMAAGYDGRSDLVLPMCGSGTLAIEAALMALRKPPALLRSQFAFRHYIGFDEDPWNSIRNRCRKKEKDAPAAGRIIASDIDPAAVEAARQNAVTAGVEHLIEFEVCDFAETPVPQTGGLVVVNPEYGLRLGETSGLEDVYRRLGDFLKQKCAGYTAYVLSGNKELTRHIRLKASRKYVFYNGNIECRLLKYELFRGSRG